MTPEPTFSSLAEACAKEIAANVNVMLDGVGLTLTTFELNRLKKGYAETVSRHLQPLAKDREHAINVVARLLHDVENPAHVGLSIAPAIWLVYRNEAIGRLSTPKPASSS